MRWIAMPRSTLALTAISSRLLAAHSGDEKTHQVDALFERWDRNDSPGCALGIVRDGRLIYARGYGMANLEHGIPIDRGASRSADRDVRLSTDRVFSQKKRAEPQRFQLPEPGEVLLSFGRIDPYAPSTDELRTYAGTYYSEEFETANRVYLEDGQLYREYRRSPKTPLQPTLKDQFTSDGMRIEFARDSNGVVSGYGIWFDWEWNVRFARRNTQ